MAKSALHRRDIGPGYWDNELLVDLGTFARLFFMAMWCQADREGRLEDRPRRIQLKANMLDMAQGQAEEITASLEHLGFIIRYEVGGTKYIQITNFAKHQRVHPRERSSEIPAPGDELGEPKANPRQTQGEPRSTQGLKFPSGPSGPSGPSELRVVDARACEDFAVARTGIDVGLPSSAITCASVEPPTDKQRAELTYLAESTGVDLDDMLARIPHATWTKASARVAIDRYHEIQAARKSPKTFGELKRAKGDDAIATVMREISNATD